MSSQGESIKVYLEELEITREFRRQFLKLESRYVDQGRIQCYAIIYKWDAITFPFNQMILFLTHLLK